ncbi:helix-turn-helix domain-containing protein [Sphingomonas sp. C3-2]|uniref:winged helix-turn-helix transcriptional regulator n=1 Tax=Sphingomonas sp. C3-2 TaxID=3062169 RepID=UPI00294B176E|nr:helix-turn-helix domain-containing protein [Sphingomonas sp. C3-2]WOK35742.1 helix-turn-helix domain-containing protein [Sphingomonas sp. C3-2]
MGNHDLSALHDDANSPAALLSREIIARIGDKWTLLIIHILGNGPMRFSVLKRSVGGISQKMLSQTLRALERDGIVRRTVLPTMPPAVEYALEPLGYSLQKTVSQICIWADANVAQVAAARAAFDSEDREG